MAWLMACAAILAAMTAGAHAQEPEAATRPAFSLASSQIYTTKDSPSIDLTFQQVDHLDFRIYRVKDAKAFFAGLKDPHQFGSPEPVVAQEQTWLEWLAEWKSSRRSEVRDFMRRQVSSTYRTERRKQIDKGETSRRQMLRYTTFAQVPLLNQSQLVASWREMLPRVRDAESRRLPLDLPGPGAYLIEAVNPPHRAYTIIVVSDVGLVTKAAPKQALMFAANRFTGAPLGNCLTGVVVDQKVVFSGTTTGDGTSLAAIDTTNPDAVITLAQCGNEIVVSDPGSYQFQGAARDLIPTSQRQMLRYTTFAQVPLLNQSQLVASWREMLPRVQRRRKPPPPARSPRPRRVSRRSRQSSPPRLHHRRRLRRRPGDESGAETGADVRRQPLQRRTARQLPHQRRRRSESRCSRGTTTGDGTSLASFDTTNPDAVITRRAVRQRDRRLRSGRVSVPGRGARPVAYIYTDKPIYRPGHTVRLKGVLRWRDRDAVLPFDQPQAELSIVDPDEKVLLRQQVKVDAFGAVKGDFTVPMTAPLGYYTIRLTSGDQNATGSFEVQEYRKPEFEVSVTPAQRFVVQGKQVSATITARYYFGQPVANGAVTYALYKSSYYSPFRWQDDADESEYAGYDYAGEQIGEETVRLNEKGEATITVEMPEDDNKRDYTLRIDARVTDASGREVSGKGRVVGTYGDFFLTTSLDRYVYQPGSSAELRVRAWTIRAA